MAKTRPKKGWGFFWLASGVCAVIAAISGATLPLGALVFLLVSAGTCFCLAAHYFGWTTFHPSAERTVKTWGLTIAIWMGTALLGYILWPRQSLVLLYHGEKLDGKTVILEKSCIPASPVQPNMCIDQNHPGMFDLFGIAMVADSSVEAHDVVLTFSHKTYPYQTGHQDWMATKTDAREYSYFLDREIVPAHLPVELPTFYGVPIPSPRTDIMVRVFYGDKIAQSKFTLQAPN